MNADKARELAYQSLGSNGIMLEIEKHANWGHFRCYIDKCNMTDWYKHELENGGYTVIERAFEYEINWDE